MGVWQTDGQTDDGQSDPYMLLCFAGDTKTTPLVEAKSEQANSENCGLPLGNKFDLEVGQRSLSRSQHGTIWKVFSQRTHMPSIKALPVIVQKLWPRLKFFWRTDRRTDECDLMSPRFRESGEQKAILEQSWQSRSKVSDLDIIQKGILSKVCVPNLKSLLLMMQKFWRLKFKTDILFSEPGRMSGELMS